MRTLYMISIIILWALIVLNVCNLLSLRRLQKSYMKSIKASNEALARYLEAADNLLAEEERLRTLRENEENVDG